MAEYVSGTFLSAYISSSSATLIHAMLTSLPVQRCASCQCCITMLAAATIHSTTCIIWTYGAGPMLAALGYVVGGAISATSCAMTLCVTTWTILSALAVAPHATRTLICRLRRARGRVSPLIPPGSPPPWDTSTIHNRRGDFLHRQNWESRFAGTRRTCYKHLVSEFSNWHLPWWLLALALQWMVIVLLDTGAKLLNYRVAILSYRETLPLLGEDTPTMASAVAIGRWMARWLRRSHDGARRHLCRRSRTLAHALLVLSTHLLCILCTHGISGITHGTIDWFEARLVIILPLLFRRASDLLRAAYSILWLHWHNASHRILDVLTRLQGILSWFLFACKFGLTLSMLAWQHWTGPRALPVMPLPRAARSRPEDSAVAVAAAAAAAATVPQPPSPQPNSPPSPPYTSGGTTRPIPADTATLPPRGRVGYALKLKHGKTRAKAKESHALPLVQKRHFLVSGRPVTPSHAGCAS